jgi:hypothetical protein
VIGTGIEEKAPATPEGFWSLAKATLTQLIESTLGMQH